MEGRDRGHGVEVSSSQLVRMIRRRRRPLAGPADLDPLLGRIGRARFVLLGEASHGTAEYYRWRAAITRRLIVERGFGFVAVEGDWPACDAVDRYVRGASDARDAREALAAFRRWPAWLWANEEVAELVEWLRRHNATRPAADRVGFHGLDVYSAWESLHAVIGFLRRSRHDAVEVAIRASRCFEPDLGDERRYARATAGLVPAACADEVAALLARLRREAREAALEGRGDAAFRARQNARVVKNADAYNRAMARGGVASWNVRDRHMMETLEALAAHQRGVRAIVWEHNTHVGDARFTDMAEQGVINVGQLARERFRAEGVVLVGFGSHRGTVVASRAWGARRQVMDVPPARRGAWEDLLHRAWGGDGLLLLDGAREPASLQALRGHRAIGAVYQPESEQLGNYVPTNLPRRYDAFLFVDQSEALHPLRAEPRDVPGVEVRPGSAG